ncbi:MAG TPA: bifunctional precorrin-2 dehydrogenase/sirohydrochlorin ferrochelatase [Gemmatimonadaceae bacterium]
MSGIPLLVSPDGLRVLVVGGGQVATRKARQFATARALVRIVAPVLCEDLERLVLEFAIEVERRPYVSDDIGGAHLVFAATNDRGVNEAIARDADASGRLANVTDQSDGGQFSVMAAHRRGPLTVGVSAGGVPVAAQRIRDAIAERFDSRYADALESLVTLRQSVLSGEGRDAWRQRCNAVVGDDFCDAVEQGRIAQRVAPWP